LGKVQGHAKKVDNIFFDPEKFNYGDILICQAIDPDYLPFLKKAAGVVTEQGGVTSHGSIICRELKIPAISGVVNLLDLIMENELVEVDAYNEVLKVVDKNGLLDNEILIKKELMTDPAIVGNKAANIFLASDKKIKVPDFHILCYETIRELYYNDPVKLKDLVQKVCYDLGIYPKSQFILRSSCVFEDSPKHFYAGYYKSVIMKNGEEIEAVEKIINHNKDKGYRGSIILQKFLEADYTGVCMLGDVNYKNTRHLVVEYSKGFINHATSGGLGINRFVYNVFTDEFVAEEIADEDRNNIQLDIIKWFNKIEAKFPNPTYLEWGCKDGEFYLYQLRIKLK
jgi:phosphohistidine swiveling domain-containing protein